MPSAEGSSVGSTLFRAKKLAGRLPAGGGTMTVRLINVVDVRLPEVPVTETADVPAAAEAATVRVRMLFEVGLAGLHVDVTPVCSPDTARLTEAENPLAGPNSKLLLTL